jgi:hypothetical protein
MERVAFLVEKTGERIACMLNPETVVARRSAGIVRRSGTSGPLQGLRQSDDLLLYVGGGSTEMIFDLLFDTTLAADSGTAAGEAVPGDVRVLTRPLWNLAENSADDQGMGQLPVVRFVWGTGWNIQGLVTAVAERLEFFDETGIPRRSWLRMKFCRVNVPEPITSPAPAVTNLEELLQPARGETSALARAAVEVTGGAREESEGEAAPSRLDEIAHSTYGNASLWRLVAWFNDVTDPLHVAAGTLLRIPDLPALSTEKLSARQRP